MEIFLQKRYIIPEQALEYQCKECYSNTEIIFYKELLQHGIINDELFKKKNLTNTPNFITKIFIITLKLYQIFTTLSWSYS